MPHLNTYCVPPKFHKMKTLIIIFISVLIVASTCYGTTGTPKICFLPENATILVGSITKCEQQSENIWLVWLADCEILAGSEVPKQIQAEIVTGLGGIFGIGPVLEKDPVDHKAVLMLKTSAGKYSVFHRSLYELPLTPDNRTFYVLSEEDDSLISEIRDVIRILLIEDKGDRIIKLREIFEDTSTPSHLRILSLKELGSSTLVSGKYHDFYTKYVKGIRDNSDIPWKCRVSADNVLEHHSAQGYQWSKKRIEFLVAGCNAADREIASILRHRLQEAERRLKLVIEKAVTDKEREELRVVLTNLHSAQENTKSRNGETLPPKPDLNERPQTKPAGKLLAVSLIVLSAVVVGLALFLLLRRKK